MTMIISTIVELLAVGLIIFGFCHEDKVIKFEDKVIEAVKNRIGMK